MLEKLLAFLVGLGICTFFLVMCIMSISAQESRREEDREFREALAKAEEQRKKDEMRAEILAELDQK